MKNVKPVEIETTPQLDFNGKDESQKIRDLSIEENSRKIIVFLVLTTVELQIKLNQIEEK